MVWNNAKRAKIEPGKYLITVETAYGLTKVIPAVYADNAWWEYHDKGRGERITATVTNYGYFPIPPFKRYVARRPNLVSAVQVGDSGTFVCPNGETLSYKESDWVCHDEEYNYFVLSDNPFRAIYNELEDLPF